MLRQEPIILEPPTVGDNLRFLQRRLGVMRGATSRVPREGSDERNAAYYEEWLRDHLRLEAAIIDARSMVQRGITFPEVEDALAEIMGSSSNWNSALLLEPATLRDPERMQQTRRFGDAKIVGIREIEIGSTTLMRVCQDVLQTKPHKTTLILGLPTTQRAARSAGIHVVTTRGGLVLS